MAGRVPEVQGLAHSRFGFICLDNLRLEGDTPFHNVRQVVCGFARFKQRKQRPIVENSGFNRLRRAVCKLIRRERGKRVRVANHQRRLMKQPR
ncbi:hypothetical protein SDC9_147988 [bioreactor metagenome]|uniref:Uncharacterized protein n=1 Tax=bioreactor metagenome TaxID=1076179 RepID=A0A645EHJ4_9ZZZZ